MRTDPLLARSALLSAALAGVAACGAADPPPPLRIVARRSGGECLYMAGNRSLSLEAFVALARRRPRGSAAIDLTGDVPFKCLGAAVEAAQRMNGGRMGFVSEAAPEPAGDGAKTRR